MEEWITNRLNKELGERGVAKAYLVDAREQYPFADDPWTLIISIVHKDIEYREVYWLSEVLCGTKYIHLPEMVERYEKFVKDELLGRFYSKEEES